MTNAPEYSNSQEETAPKPRIVDTNQIVSAVRTKFEKAWNDIAVRLNLPVPALFLVFTAIFFHLLSQREASLKPHYPETIQSVILSLDGTHYAVSYENGRFEVRNSRTDEIVRKRHVSQHRVEQIMLHEEISSEDKTIVAYTTANGKIHFEDMVSGESLINMETARDFLFAPKIAYSRTNQVIYVVGETTGGKVTGSILRPPSELNLPSTKGQPSTTQFDLDTTEGQGRLIESIWTPLPEAEQTKTLLSIDSLANVRFAEDIASNTQVNPIVASAEKFAGEILSARFVYQYEKYNGDTPPCRDGIATAIDNAYLWIISPRDGICGGVKDIDGGRGVHIDIDGQMISGDFVRESRSDEAIVTHALVGLNDGSARLYDLQRRKEIAHYNGHGAAVDHVIISEDQSTALLGARDGSIQIIKLDQPIIFGRVNNSFLSAFSGIKSQIRNTLLINTIDSEPSGNDNLDSDVSSEDVSSEEVIAGECRASPDSQTLTRTLTKTVIVRDAYTELDITENQYDTVQDIIEIVPAHREGATFEMVSRDIVVQEASEERTIIPAVFETVTETAYFPGTDVTETYEKSSLKRPPQVVSRTVPSAVRKENARVVKTDGPPEARLIPAQKKPFSKRIVSKPSTITEKPVPPMERTLTIEVECP